MGCSEHYCTLWHVTLRDLFTWVPTLSNFSLDPSSRWKSFYGLQWTLLYSLARDVTWTVYMGTNCLHFQFRAVFNMEDFRREVRGRTFLRNVDEILSDNMAYYPTRQHSCQFLGLLRDACLVCAFYRTWHHVCRSLVPGVSWDCSVSFYKSWNCTFGIAYKITVVSTNPRNRHSVTQLHNPVSRRSQFVLVINIFERRRKINRPSTFKVKKNT